MDNLLSLVSRMSLHEDEENQHRVRIILGEYEAVAPADRIDAANDVDDLNPDAAVMQVGSTKKISSKQTEKGSV